MKYYIWLVIALLLPCLTIAQKRKCAQPQHTAKLQMLQGYSALKIEGLVPTREIPCDSMIVPVAIHFIGTTAKRSCLETFVDQQLKIVNDDFAGKNLDLVKYFEVANNYPLTNVGYSCVKFRIADKNHPESANLMDGQKAITINQLAPETDWVYEWKDYLNIFVFAIEDNVLGYSPLGGRGKGDGVVIAKFAFGGKGWCGDISQNNNFQFGRTLTHELGHYFAMPHVWGTGCKGDDGFGDTPNQEAPNYGCIEKNISCGTTDLHMNFMDYGDDDCIYMFTAKQAARTEIHLQINLPHLVDNGKQVISELQPITPVIDTPIVVVDTPDVNEPEEEIIVPESTEGMSYYTLIGIAILAILFMFFSTRND